MKIWLKLFIGAILGIGLGFFLPLDDSPREFFAFLAEIIVSIGRYVLYPLVFFSIAIGAYKLKQNKKTLGVTLRAGICLILFSGLFAILGTLSVLLLSPARIPIIIEEGSPLAIPGIMETLRALFPRNLFQIFNDPGNYLLPVAFLGLVVGFNLSFNNQVTRPIRDFLDALSQVFFRINSLVVEIMGIGMIALSAYFILQLRSTPALELFTQLLVVLLVDLLVITFAIIPLLFYFFTPDRRNPYRWLYALAAPALAGIISGDNYFSMAVLIKTGHTNLGIPRQVGALTYPFFALFGKAGTALVTGVSFVVILKSYSSLGITLEGVLWVMAYAFLLSFITGNYPALGFLAGISLMCGLYGQGMEEGYLILTPVIPLLVNVGVFLNVITAGTASFLVAEGEKLRKEVKISNFV